ncbi:DNA repair protein rad51d [Dimargaris verticillata]|uniref:DNA repair protein rad51d n=1 Tax=Dimargaris verticillata TaxID=2761393 RepID=A0A9W8EAI5_9FUNG|nr:DNA repair protein rad51d [Dimargaris verticillata]
MPLLSTYPELTCLPPEPRQSVLEALAGAGVTTDRQLLCVNWSWLTTQVSLVEQPILDTLLSAVQARYACSAVIPPSVGTSAVPLPLGGALLYFGIPALDKLIDPGLHEGSILELIEAPSSGKTLAVHWLCAHTLYHHAQTQITFVDGAAWFSPSLLMECLSTLSSSPIPFQTSRSYLDRVTYIQCATIDDVLAVIDQETERPRSATHNPASGLYVFDGLPIFLNSYPYTNRQHHAMVATLARSLRHLANECSAAVTVTNAAIPKYNSSIRPTSNLTTLEFRSRPDLKPMLGFHWSHMADMTILLSATPQNGSTPGSAEETLECAEYSSSPLDLNDATSFPTVPPGGRVQCELVKSPRAVSQ